MLEFSNCRYNLSIQSVVVFVPSLDIMGLGHKIFTHLKVGLCSCFDIFVRLQRKHWCMFFFTNIYKYL